MEVQITVRTNAAACFVKYAGCLYLVDKTGVIEWLKQRLWLRGRVVNGSDEIWLLFCSRHSARKIFLSQESVPWIVTCGKDLSSCSSKTENITIKLICWTHSEQTENFQLGCQVANYKSGGKPSYGWQLSTESGLRFNVGILFLNWCLTTSVFDQPYRCQFGGFLLLWLPVALSPKLCFIIALMIFRCLIVMSHWWIADLQQK